MARSKIITQQFRKHLDYTPANLALMPKKIIKLMLPRFLLPYKLMVL
jgi:hypothetical protein